MSETIVFVIAGSLLGQASPDLDVFREYGAIATLAAFAALVIAGRILAVKSVEKIERGWEKALEERDLRITERDRTIDRLLQERNEWINMATGHLGIMERQNEVLERATNR